MKLTMITKIASREVRNNWGRSLLFCVNLYIGLLAVSVILIFSAAFEAHLSSKSKELAGGDIVIKSSYKIAEEKLSAIESQLPAETTSASLVSLFSMVSSNDSTRLVLVNGVSKTYPLFGDLKTSSASRWQSSLQNGSGVSDPELLLQLKLKVGDSVRVGELPVSIKGKIELDTAGASRGFSIAPKLYLPISSLPDTGLIQYGSRVSYYYFYRNNNPALDWAPIIEKIRNVIDDKTVKVDSHNSASQQMGRTVRYLNDFLALAGLVGLFLSGFGVYFLLRDYIDFKAKEIALLRTLGCRPGEAVSVFFVQLLGLTALSAVMATISSLALAQILPYVMPSILPQSFSVGLSQKAVVAVVILALASSIGFSLPLLRKAASLSPMMLLSGGRAALTSMTWRESLWFLPVVLVFYFAAAWLSKSFVVASIFVGAGFASFAILWLSGLVVLRLLKKASVRRPLWLNLSLLNIRRQARPSLIVFTVIGMAATLLNLPTQISAGLYGELSPGAGVARPDLFLFDIQEDQLPSLEQYLAGKEIFLNNKSPLVRARLASINGKSITEISLPTEDIQTREDERQESFLSRAFNLSSRSHLYSTEEVTEGRFFETEYAPGSDAEISLEQRFAERIGVEIGDTMVFDISGVEIKGRVVGLRRVRWTSFNPNFFVLLQPGVLDEAPKAYVADISNIATVEKADLQVDLVSKYPNISMVDVTKTISRIESITTQMINALGSISLLAVAAGLFVLFAVFSVQINHRLGDLNLLRVFGMRRKYLLLSILTESSVLAATALVTTFVSVLVLTEVTSKVVFGVSATPNILQLGLNLLIIEFLAILTGYIVFSRVVRSHPRELLSDDS